jgi:ABC-2 type transport system permease protein
MTSSTESGGAGASTLSASAGSVTGTGAMAALVARRDAVLAWRDPMRRLPWLIVLFMAVFWPLVVFRGAAGFLAVFGVILGSWMAGSQSANQFGVEGSGLWLHLVGYADRGRARGEVLGHALAAIVPGAVCVLIALVTVSSVRGDWELTPAAAGVCLAALLGACAIASWVSAALPFAMPQSRKSLFASSVPGQKGRTSGAQLLILLGGLVSAIPAGGLAVLAGTIDPAWGWAALIVGVLTGLVMLAVAIPATANRYLATGPEILAVVAAGDRV